MSIFVGWPGRCHDARILANSSVFAKAEEDSLLPTTTENTSGVAVPVVILGDPTYPLLPWLINVVEAHATALNYIYFLEHSLSKGRFQSDVLTSRVFVSHK